MFRYPSSLFCWSRKLATGFLFFQVIPAAWMFNHQEELAEWFVLSFPKWNLLEPTHKIGSCDLGLIGWQILFIYFIFISNVCLVSFSKKLDRSEGRAIGIEAVDGHGLINCCPNVLKLDLNITRKTHLSESFNFLYISVTPGIFTFKSIQREDPS